MSAMSSRRQSVNQQFRRSLYDQRFQSLKELGKQMSVSIQEDQIFQAMKQSQVSEQFIQGRIFEILQDTLLKERQRQIERLQDQAVRLDQKFWKMRQRAELAQKSLDKLYQEHRESLNRSRIKQAERPQQILDLKHKMYEMSDYIHQLTNFKQRNQKSLAIEKDKNGMLREQLQSVITELNLMRDQKAQREDTYDSFKINKMTTQNQQLKKELSKVKTDLERVKSELHAEFAEIIKAEQQASVQTLEQMKKKMIFKGKKLKKKIIQQKKEIQFYKGNQRDCEMVKKEFEQKFKGLQIETQRKEAQIQTRCELDALSKEKQREMALQKKEKELQVVAREKVQSTLEDNENTIEELSLEIKKLDIEKTKMKKEVRELQQKIKDLQEDKTIDQETSEKLSNQITELKTLLELQRNSVSNAEKTIVHQKSDIKNLSEQTKNLTRRNKKLEKQLSQYKNKVQTGQNQIQSQLSEFIKFNSIFRQKVLSFLNLKISAFRSQMKKCKNFYTDQLQLLSKDVNSSLKLILYKSIESQNLLKRNYQKKISSLTQELTDKWTNKLQEVENQLQKKYINSSAKYTQQISNLESQIQKYRSNILSQKTQQENTVKQLMEAKNLLRNYKQENEELRQKLERNNRAFDNLQFEVQEKTSFIKNQTERVIEAAQKQTAEQFELELKNTKFQSSDTISRLNQELQSVKFQNNQEIQSLKRNFQTQQGSLKIKLKQEQQTSQKLRERLRQIQQSATLLQHQHTNSLSQLESRLRKFQISFTSQYFSKTERDFTQRENFRRKLGELESKIQLQKEKFQAKLGQKDREIQQLRSHHRYQQQIQ